VQNTYIYKKRKRDIQQAECNKKFLIFVFYFLFACARVSKLNRQPQTKIEAPKGGDRAETEVRNAIRDQTASKNDTGICGLSTARCKQFL